MKAWFLPFILCGLMCVFLGQSNALSQVKSQTTSAAGPPSAAPPPEPELPAWGQYLAPVDKPIMLSPLEYNVVGPPRGYTQQSAGQDYQSVISDPNGLLESDLQIGQSVDIFRPDGIAPIGVVGDHTLPTGAAHISYRYLQDSLDQNYDGSQRISVGSIAAKYPFAPTRMMRNSQVALVEYGVTQDLTMLAYLPFQSNSIKYQTAGGDFDAAFANPGDIRIMGLFALRRGERSQSHLNLGISLPVGLLQTQTVMPSPVAPTLPYQIRTSSGSYDLLLGYTYRRQTDNWTLGGQINGVIRTGLNTLGYELGDELQLTTWAARRWTPRWSTSARLDVRLVDQISGADARLDPALSPVNQTNTQASRTVNGLLGVNYYLYLPERRLPEQRLFLELGLPLYQSLNGPQLGQTWTLNAGWGMTF